MHYRSDFDELFTHLCWKYGLDPYETDGDELGWHCTEAESQHLADSWDPRYDD